MASRIQPAVLFLYASFILRAFIVARGVSAVAEDDNDPCPNIRATPEGWKLRRVGEEHLCCGCPSGYKYVRPCIKKKYNTTVCEICEDGTFLDKTAHVQTECIPYPSKPTTTTKVATTTTTITTTTKPKTSGQTTSLESSNFGNRGGDSSSNTLMIVVAVLATVLLGGVVFLIWRAVKKCLKKRKKTNNVEMEKMENILEENDNQRQKTFHDGMPEEKKKNRAKNDRTTQDQHHNDSMEEEEKLLPEKGNLCNEIDRLKEGKSTQEIQPEIRKKSMVVNMRTDADEPAETKATLPDGDCVTNDSSLNTSNPQPEVLPAQPRPTENKNTKPKEKTEECNLKETQPMSPTLPAGDCSTNSGTPDSSIDTSSNEHDLFSQPPRTNLDLQVNSVESGILLNENTESLGSPTSPTTIEEPTERLSSIECNYDKEVDDTSDGKAFDPDFYQGKTSNTKPFLLGPTHFNDNRRTMSAAAAVCDPNALRDSENNFTIVRIQSCLTEIFQINEGVYICEEFVMQMAKDYELPEEHLNNLQKTKYTDAGKLLADVIKYIHNTKGRQFRADEIFKYFSRKNQGLLAEVVQSRINEHPISKGAKHHAI